MSSHPRTPPPTPQPNKQPHWVVRGIERVKCSLEERRSRKKQEPIADRAARRTATATVWIALSTAATVVIGISHFVTFDGQLDVMRKQLAEMKSNGEQTARIIAAYEKLAAVATAGEGRALRAKISIPTAELESFEIGVAPNAFVQIENTGQGTANGKMRGVVKIASLTDSNFPIGKALSANVTTQPNSKISRTIQASQKLTESQLEAIIKGRSAIIVYGDYRFSDGSKIVTRCEYRLFYRGARADTAAAGMGGPFVPAPGPVTAKTPILRPTAGYNHCDEEKPAPGRASD